MWLSLDPTEVGVDVIADEQDFQSLPRMSRCRNLPDFPRHIDAQWYFSEWNDKPANDTPAFGESAGAAESTPIVRTKRTKKRMKQKMLKIQFYAYAVTAADDIILAGHALSATVKVI